MFGEWKTCKSNILFVRLQVLCEVETSVETLDLTVALPHSKHVTEHPHYQKRGDLTRMLIQDWGIFNFYKSFLKEWLDAFNDATAEESGICGEMKINSKVTTNKKSTKGKKMSKMRKLSTKYVLATIFNQTSLPFLLEDPKKDSARKRLLTKKPMRKDPLRKRLPKNRLRNKRKKLTAREQT